MTRRSDRKALRMDGSIAIDSRTRAPPLQPHAPTAWHRPYGLTAATTAGAIAGTRPAQRMSPPGNVSPLDIAPTVLARAGLPVAADMPGRVVPALTGGGSVTNIASYGLHRLPDQPS